MKVLAAMSGGVDSSVAAARLLDDGHDVVGVTMKLWGGESDTGCCSVSDVDDARRVAQQLGVDHHVFNFGDEFEAHVVSPYLEAHASGRTPNPCVECNRRLKFDKLVRRADALGFDAIATGHHARRISGPNRTWRVGRGADAAKDQSYVLYPLGQSVLSRTLFPIGDLTKAEVRDRAATLGLRTATKPDSQDVCFVTRNEGRQGFLGRRIDLHPATVVDATGLEVGQVDAVELVTIGQRKGLSLGGGASRRFAVDVDVAARVVTVGDEADLDRELVELTQVTWSSDPVAGRLLVQCSAHGEPRPARVVLADGADEAVITWDRPQRCVAPGQSVVLYEGECVVGGGIAR